ncbi:MAG: hypothetical protein H7Y31_10650 [Chitinophagaceae bacterium]|nr:hypothetical protein [Chitinophagaceae bacterium]
MKYLILSISIICCLLLACKKESFITGSDARLTTSVDSLHFDTVFTSTGSITRFFRIYNENDQKLRLSNVQLAGGTNSSFKINVDGIPGPTVSNIELEANDSVYVFVTVKIDPTTPDQPFVISDSISIEYNGNKRWVQLQAWGQNARFFRSRIITANETWDDTRPYVILGGLQVDTGVTLTISRGTKVYLHADAPLVVDGTLKVNGEKYDSTRVVFRSDRLDEPYRNYPASWPGIYFRGESKDNVLQFANVINAYQGVVVDKPSTNGNPKLTLQQCIIDNCYDAGIFGLRTRILAENTLISNCGKNIVLAYGGTYDFNHCTSVAYSNSFILHKEPALLLTDFIRQDNSFVTSNVNALFRNCIFWGDNGTVDDEVITLKQGATVFNVDFQNCLWKVKTPPANATITNVIANENPQFDSVNNQRRIYSFQLKDDSPAKDKGIATGLSIDLSGNPRPLGLPDIGCYEKQ